MLQTSFKRFELALEWLEFAFEWLESRSNGSNWHLEFLSNGENLHLNG